MHGGATGHALVLVLSLVRFPHYQDRDHEALTLGVQCSDPSTALLTGNVLSSPSHCHELLRASLICHRCKLVPPEGKHRILACRLPLAPPRSNTRYRLCASPTSSMMCQSSLMNILMFSIRCPAGAACGSGDAPGGAIDEASQNSDAQGVQRPRTCSRGRQAGAVRYCDSLLR